MEDVNKSQKSLISIRKKIVEEKRKYFENYLEYAKK